MLYEARAAGEGRRGIREGDMMCGWVGGWFVDGWWMVDGVKNERGRWCWRDRCVFFC